MMRKSGTPTSLRAAAAFVVALAGVLPARARTVAYVSNADSREIYVLEVNEGDGGLKVVEKVPTAGAVMPLAVSPDRRHLFASLRSEPYAVSSFAIAPDTGRLTPVKTSPLADNSAYLSTDRTGRYLFAASFTGGSISVNAIGPGGAVDPTPLRVIPTGGNAHAVAADSSNRFVLATNLGRDVIHQFRFDAANGDLTPNAPPAVAAAKGAGPRHFVFHPGGRLVFCTNELDGTVGAYRFGPAGALDPLATASVMPPGFRGGPPSAADVHLTPDGRFLYASERTSSTLAAFRVDAESGRLTPIGNYPTESQPRGFNIDPGGKYLIAAGQKSDRLTAYAIDRETGALREASRLDVGKNPNWVEIITLP